MEVTRFSTPRMTPSPVATWKSFVSIERLHEAGDYGESYSYRGGTKLDRFKGVFDLEEAAFW